MKAKTPTLAFLAAVISGTQALGGNNLDLSLFSMPAPEMLALNLAVSEIPLNPDTMLRRARDAPNDPWERQDAKAAFISDLQGEIDRFASQLERHRRGFPASFRMIQNMPVQLKAVHVESRTFSIDLPFLATAYPFQEGAPLNVAAAPAVGFIWKYSAEEGGRLGGNFCDDRFRQGAEQIRAPRELGPMRMRFAPNLSGHPPTGLSTPPYRMRACTQLNVDTNETARDLFRKAHESAFFLNAKCRALVPTALNLRGHFDGLTSACFVDTLILSATPDPEPADIIALWDPVNGEWEYQSDPSNMFVGQRNRSLNAIARDLAQARFRGEMIIGGERTGVLVTGANGELGVTYPELGCAGRWTLIGASGSTLIFRETIGEGTDICGGNGYVKLDVLPSDGDHDYGLDWVRQRGGPAVASGGLNER